MDISEKRAELEGFTARILAEAAKCGATAAEVSASHDIGLSVSVRNRDVETVEFNQDRGFGITVYFGQRKGTASTSDSSEDAIVSTVRAACDIARYTEADEFAGIAEPGLLAHNFPDLDLYHPSTVDTDTARSLALECEAGALAGAGDNLRSDGASFSSHTALRMYANSNGFLGSHTGTRYGLSCVMIGQDAGGAMQRDYWYAVTRRLDELEAARTVGERATQRVLRRLSPRKAPTGTFPVAYSPDVSSGLVSSLLGALSGGALYRKASFLLDSLGKQVMPERFSVVEFPHRRGALGSAAFDGDGVATRENRFVDAGMVASYALSVYSGRRLKMPTTGNAGGVHNVEILGPVTPVNELLRAMNRGLLVTECMGQGVNMVTGDYSRGASGFWVENGEIAYPVDEVTVASNMQDMLLGISAIGDDPDRRGNIHTPTMLIGSMTVAGAG
ncbi:MAG: metalloprotease PmbA [Pseudomonadales bacterium]|nr:metalloprotease PmbA [Pseudomonadales bacterium]MCP5185391.1 metalloprotease PmbA [Pseudomonadales bacterium]